LKANWGLPLISVDDFTQLNEKFIKARRDYEALLESSMSHPPQPTYHQYAMRPGPGYVGGAPGGYPPQGPPQEQRYYTPGPQGIEGCAQRVKQQLI